MTKKRVGSNFILFITCQKWVHKWRSGQCGEGKFLQSKPVSCLQSCKGVTLGITRKRLHTLHV